MGDRIFGEDQRVDAAHDREETELTTCNVGAQ